MNRVSIDTTQNVTIDYEIANIGDRLLAFIIDGLVQIGYFFFVMIMIGSAQNPEPFIILTFISVPIFLYFLVCEIFMDGQSIGKRARDIKVVKVDGTQATIGNYLIRWLLRPIDYFFGIGVLAILFNDKGQRIGDLAAGTTLIKLQKRVSLNDTLFTEVEENYEPYFPQVQELPKQHIELINKVLNSETSLSNNNAVEKLAEKTKSTLGVDAEMPPRKFLRTVVKDYNYYAS